ncbi:MAG: ABC transporter substrate-binding protein [Candidatus Sumerlaeia bacterium]|nr:ABC transporter substrate-binding protein [Candidatus Sumerlaeia bacterium]
MRYLRFPTILALIAALAGGCTLPPQTGPRRAELTSAPAVANVAPHAAEESANPLAKYVKRAVVDEFNPDVSDAERRNPPKPRRGGSIVIRMPTDIATLDPLLQQAAHEQTIISYLTEFPESLIRQDAETLEFMPKMAEYWKVRDYIETQDGTRIEGLVTSSETEPLVTILPNASQWTFYKKDIVTSDTAAGIFTTRFGHTLRGRARPLDLTVEITEQPASAPLTLARDQLGTWLDESGAKPRRRPSIKRHCIYEFHLRPGIQWHDGRPVTMEDCKLWFDTMRNERVDCAPLRIYYIDIEKMELLDSMTAKFTYRKPFALALGYCGAAGFIPRHIYQPERFQGDPEGFADFYNKHPMALPGKTQYIGCGPYKLDHWTAGQEIVLVRNENYWACKANLPWWDPQRPYLDKITWRVIMEKTPALREMENGNIDADFDIEPDTWFLPTANSPRFTSRYVRATNITPAYTYIGWNLRRPLFQDVNVRRALSMLIPRQQILNTIHYGLGRVIEGPFFIDGPCADRTVKPIPYDPAEARRILRRAGWIDRDGDGILDKNGQKFEFEYLVHTAREYHAKVADIVKQYLGRAGIQVNIRKVDFTVLQEAVRDRNFDACRFAWTDMIDTDPYQIWHSTQSKGRGSNNVSYSNPRVDELIERGREEFDPLKRWAMYREVYRIICEDQPFTFLYTFNELYFYARRFRGVKFYRTFPGYDFTEWYEAKK